MGNLKYLVLIIFTAFFSLNVVGQTFTYNGGSGCSFNSTSSTCWTRTNTCSNNNSAIPLASAIFNKTNGCPVVLIINADLTIPGNVVMGGVFDEIIVQNGATLTFSGNVTLDKDQDMTWDLRKGGKIDVQGASGILLDAGTTTSLNLKGDNSLSSVESRVTTTQINYANDVSINIGNGAALIVTGDSFISGKDVSLNIKGFFRTGGSMKISGNNARVNVNTPGIAIINQHFELSGQGGIKVTGTSEVEVGGDLKVVGNALFDVESTSFFRVCGTHSSSGNFNGEIASKIQVGNCRILPIGLAQFDVKFQSDARKTEVLFSTAKEWEISYFEIERAINQVETWETIGSVEAVGFSDKITEYKFIDQTIPASGGIAYYRVKQLNLKGEFIYSEVKSTKIDAVKGNSAWKAYPNPSHRGTYIHLELMDKLTQSANPIAVKISDMVGTEVSSATFEQPKQVEEFLNQHLVSKNSGLYVVNLSWDGQTEMIKLFVR
ncbi:T9SS type A sorting domain-containing protein [Algoriphagus aquatilis]|uniref:T9SS type A sorting domain-containing protein n=1 Tax=Algoriphagus aquatilis TaxID=490186 RepID=A0ABW0BU78_9BACT